MIQFDKQRKNTKDHRKWNWKHRLDRENRGRGEGEEEPKPKRREQGIKKQSETEDVFGTGSLYTQSKLPTIDYVREILYGIKTRKYKYTYSIKKPALEILGILEGRKIKFSEGDLKELSYKSFRKIHQGKESTPPK